MSLRLNLGSGQRPFEKPWINVDLQAKWLGGTDPNVKWPEGGLYVQSDIRSMPMFADGSAEMIVLYHVAEHFGMGDADGVIKECHRILEPGGKLIVVCPDMEAFAINYLRSRGWSVSREDQESVYPGLQNWPPINEWIYVVNTYGAYMESEADRHKNGWSQKGLLEYIGRLAPWSKIGQWDRVRPEGTDVNWDWWFATCEAVK